MEIKKADYFIFDAPSINFKEKKRFKHSFKIDLDTKEIYDFYKQSDKVKDPVNRKLFNEIVFEFNRKIASLILDKAFEYKMPYKLGFMRIASRKRKLQIKNGVILKNKLKVNWGETLKLFIKNNPQFNFNFKTARDFLYKLKSKQFGDNPPEHVKLKNIYHFNQHSDGYIFKIIWDKSYGSIHKRLMFYNFKPSKDFRLTLGKIVKGGDYVKFINDWDRDSVAYKYKRVSLVKDDDTRINSAAFKPKYKQKIIDKLNGKQ